MEIVLRHIKIKERRKIVNWGRNCPRKLFPPICRSGKFESFPSSTGIPPWKKFPMDKTTSEEEFPSQSGVLPVRLLAETWNLLSFVLIKS